MVVKNNSSRDPGAMNNLLGVLGSIPLWLGLLIEAIADWYHSAGREFLHKPCIGADWCRSCLLKTHYLRPKSSSVTASIHFTTRASSDRFVNERTKNAGGGEISGQATARIAMTHLGNGECIRE